MNCYDKFLRVNNKRILVYLSALMLSLCSLAPAKVYGQVLASDSLALVDLYKSTNGANWKNTINNNKPWLVGPVSGWYGVAVTGNRVTTLNLYENNLSGKIPESIGNLEALMGLDIYQAYLDTIPASIGNLVNLATLELDHCRLTGKLPNMGNLRNLRFLSLSNNKFADTLPSFITNFTRLEKLYLVSTNLSGKIPDDIGNLKALKSLGLGGSNLSGPIPESIVNLVDLESIDINSNHFSGRLPLGIADLPNLSYLHLHTNSFNFDDLEPLFASTNIRTTVDFYSYSPQAKIGQIEKRLVLNGSSVTLSALEAGTSPNNKFEWYKDGKVLSNAASGKLIIPAFSGSTHAGAYTCRVTNPNVPNLVLTRAPITLEEAKPCTDYTASFTGPVVTCVGTGVTFHTESKLGEKYLWSVNGEAVSNNGQYSADAASFDYSFDTAGTYTIGLYVERDEQNCVATISKQIEVHSAPLTTVSITGPTTTCSTSPTSFQTEAIAGASYLWFVNGIAVSNNGAFSSTATTFQHSFPSAGSYTVGLEVAIEGQGCNSKAEQQVEVNPLPTATITLRQPVSCATARDGVFEASSDAVSYRFLQGTTLIASGTLTHDAAGTGPISISGLAKGNYVLELSSEQGCISTINTTIPDGSPVVTMSCLSYLSCDESIRTGTAQVSITYPGAPANTGGFRCYVREGAATGTVITSFWVAYDSTGASTGSISIDNAQPDATYYMDVRAMETDQSCPDCLLEICSSGTSFTFPKPKTTITMVGTTTVNSAPTYISCGSVTAKFSYSSSKMNTCSQPIKGYSVYLYQNGMEINQIHRPAFEGAQISATDSFPDLATGSYTIRVVAGTQEGSYHCVDERSFQVVKVEDWQVNTTVTMDECRLATARAIVNTTLPAEYKWFKEEQGQWQQLAGLSGAVAERIAPGSYYVEASTPGGSCVDTAHFAFAEPALLGKPLIRDHQEGDTAKKVCDPIAISEGNEAGIYTMTWLRNDTVVFSQALQSEAGVVSSTLPERLLLKGSYVVSISNELGCYNESDSTSLDKPQVARSFQLCMQWGAVAPVPVAAIPVTDQPTLAATTIKQALEEKAAQCMVMATEEASLAFSTTCYADSSLRDSLTLDYGVRYEHFTLYYYDRAGNLVRTVPPAGVELLTGEQANREQATAHRLVTRYDYNSLGQLTRQYTPDGDTTHFVYNEQGQLRLSQNAVQKAEGSYSYTKYDHLGRVVEVGQSKDNSPDFLYHKSQTANNELFAKDMQEDVAQKFPAEGGSAVLSDRTVTVYSSPAEGVSYFDREPQRYLLNRVSYSYRIHGLDTSSQRTYTYYSYDAHGNVKWLAQQVPGLGRRYMAYDYDLISGKVLQVRYNEWGQDRFFHRYSYDEDNRLTLAETSREGILWDRDASYSYYAHGPLKRQELGHDKVQGLDYVYTLQGWLKGINSPDGSSDLGSDGESNSFSKDVWSMSLGYYKGDYLHAGSAFRSLRESSDALQPEHELYNGNIASWSAKTASLGASVEKYRYDKLNRLISSQLLQFTDSIWTPTAAYQTGYSYDGNGNLLTLERKDQAGTQLDQLSYRYELDGEGKLLKNRLQAVSDAVAGTAYAEDIEGETTYQYDAIGNLISDSKEQLQIEWDVYGKVRRVSPAVAGTSKPTLTYLYDASGNRVAKQVVEGSSQKTTAYVRDASGNTMSTYELTAGSLPLWNEVSLYGSDRLGMLKPGQKVHQDTGEEVLSTEDGEAILLESDSSVAAYAGHSYLLTGDSAALTLEDGFEFSPTGEDSVFFVRSAEATDTVQADVYARYVGQKQYELKDHLGNVRVVVSDAKELDPDYTGEGFRLRATVASFFNYYPFGMMMPGATSSESYRYGYNGKELDNEIKGDGNSYDFGARIYDPRVGRWLSVDPLQKKYPSSSPYNFVLNSPLIYNDPTGEYAVSVHFRITYKAALKLGFSEELSNALAHYSSVYADHPKKKILFWDNVLHITWNNFKLGGDRPKYEKTSNSQDEAMSHLHSMMSDAEASEGFSEDRAMFRGLDFGWKSVFAQVEAINVDELGQGLHALQDAMAHKGAKTSDHLGFKEMETLWSSVKMTLNDLYGDTEYADRITESALTVLSVLRGSSKNLNGKNLYLKGISNDQFNQLKGALDKKGYNINYSGGFDSDDSFYEYTISKKKK
jgi:RHS repeat-associated protein